MAHVSKILVIFGVTGIGTTSLGACQGKHRKVINLESWPGIWIYLFMHAVPSLSPPTPPPLPRPSQIQSTARNFEDIFKALEE